MHHHPVLLGYTEVHGLPTALVEVWRVLLWAAMLSLLGSILYYLPQAWRCRHGGQVPEWVIWLYLGVSIVVVRTLIVTVERWNGPLVLEETPVMTIVALIWLRSRFLRRGRW